MPLAQTIETDADGKFDFGFIKPGHYTLIVEEKKWAASDWFDVEVKPEAPVTETITIDVSPFFPDCRGGHEFIVNAK
jgi:hypothetical protein